MNTCAENRLLHLTQYQWLFNNSHFMTVGHTDEPACWVFLGALPIFLQRKDDAK
jgi:hypothetical protein